MRGRGVFVALELFKGDFLIITNFYVKSQGPVTVGFFGL
jgi:hypothetical protein